MLRMGVGWCVGSLLFGYGRLASGYCLMTTCDAEPTPVACIVERNEDGCSVEGKRVAWAQPCLSFSVHKVGSVRSGITAGQLEKRVAKAFERWEAALCSGGGFPRLRVEAFPRVECDSVGYNAEGPNQNLWVFRENGWYEDVTDDNAIALTTLTIDYDTGEILDADVELNASDNQFTLSSKDVQIDLESTVLHEAGHVLGLGHSEWGTSVMTSGYEVGSLTSRKLQADDIRAICALMPPGEIPSDCDAEPLGGFSTQCHSPEGCCALAPGRKPSGISGVLGVLFFGLSVLRRRYAKVLPSQPHK